MILRLITSALLFTLAGALVAFLIMADPEQIKNFAFGPVVYMPFLVMGGSLMIQTKKRYIADFGLFLVVISFGVGVYLMFDFFEQYIKTNYNIKIGN